MNEENGRVDYSTQNNVSSEITILSFSSIWMGIPGAYVTVDYMYFLNRSA